MLKMLLFNIIILNHIRPAVTWKINPPGSMTSQSMVSKQPTAVKRSRNGASAIKIESGGKPGKTKSLLPISCSLILCADP